jgi:hypothetical protein
MVAPAPVSAIIKHADNMPGSYLCFHQEVGVDTSALHNKAQELCSSTRIAQTGISLSSVANEYALRRYH